MRSVVAFTLAVLIGCASTDQRAQLASIRVTVNPDQVKGCKSLGIIDSNEGSLRAVTLRRGGNVALSVPNTARPAYVNGVDWSHGTIGEAYFCEQPTAAK